jgi:hypothetical protein
MAWFILSRSTTATGCSGGASDIWTDHGKRLDAVTGAHHLAATRRDAAIHQKPIEGDALIKQRVALVYADNGRRGASTSWRVAKRGHASGLRLAKASIP